MESLWSPLREPTLDVRGPRTRWERARDVFADPFLAAIHAGHGAHTLGEAFFAGYQAAVERLTGERSVQALLVTEAGGNHPRAIQTVYDAETRTLSGSKAFALDDVDTGWVLASAGFEPDGRTAFVLARVDVGSASRTPLEVGWLLDVPHSAAVFRECEVSEVRSHGWSDYVKPFRTVEDVGVMAAVAAARLAAEPDVERQEAWMALLVAFRTLWELPPGAPNTIRALAGSRARFLEESQRSVAGPLAESWERDSRLLAIADRARQARLDKARGVR